MDSCEKEKNLIDEQRKKETKTINRKMEIEIERNIDTETGKQRDRATETESDWRQTESGQQRKGDIELYELGSIILEITVS